ncbi:hypothetical protein ACQ4PT_058978 [Festuca glaucescens]
MADRGDLGDPPRKAPVITGESGDISDTSTKAGGPAGVSTYTEGLWDGDEFRRRVRAIARKAAGNKIVARIGQRGDDCQLLPEIKEFKKRSLQILASKGKKNPEIDKGNKHATEKGESSAADNSTPMSKPTGGATKPPVQKIVLQKQKPRIDPVTLSMALQAGEQVDDDAIAVDFDEGGPWLYHDFPMLVTEYDGKSSIADVPVNNMKIWVKVMELPLGMMTEEWARKMGDQLGTFQEIPKSGKRNLWDDFYRIRVELDVTNPIKRWVKFQDLKTRETLRYDVKYERMPTFCYFCGLIGHADKNCLLPEEEKRVRFCVEQKASPYRGSDHRSYYLHAEPANVKRQLQFQSRSVADWKISDGMGSHEYFQGRMEQDIEESEERTVTANPAVVLQMVAAVENLQVVEGKSTDKNLVITAEQVTVAADNILKKKKKKWTRLDGGGT